MTEQEAEEQKEAGTKEKNKGDRVTQEGGMHGERLHKETMQKIRGGNEEANKAG